MAALRAKPQKWKTHFMSVASSKFQLPFKNLPACVYSPNPLGSYFLFCFFSEITAICERFNFLGTCCSIMEAETHTIFLMKFKTNSHILFINRYVLRQL